MKKSEMKIGALLSYIQMGLNVIIGLTYTPIMVRILGQSEYGLYSTAASSISMLSVLSLGFGSGYVRYYAKYKVKEDYESISSLNGLFILIFIIIGIISLICGIFLTYNLNIVFDTGLTQEEYITARRLMMLLTINLSLSFPMSVFSNIINSNEKFIFIRIVNMIKSVISPIATVIVLYAGYRSIAMVAITVVLSVVADMFFVYYVLFVLKNKFSLGKVEHGLFKSMFIYTSFIMINTIVKQVNWNVDKVLLGRFQGTKEVAIYAVASSLHVYYENFATAVSHVFRPRIHIIVNKTRDNIKLQKQELTNIMIKVGRIQFIILGLIATGLIFFGEPFIIGYWVGEGYEQSYYVMLLLILPTSFYLIQALGQEIQRALNKHQFRSIVYVFMSVINIIMTIFLCRIYGAVGAAIGTAVSVVLVDVIIINIYYNLKCNIDIILFWKNIILMCRGMIIPIVVGFTMVKLLDMYNVWIFIVSIVIYSIIYSISMWILAFNESEKSMAMKFMNTIKYKYCRIRRGN